MSENTEKKGFLSSMSNDSVAKTFIVSVALCFVCAIIVSGAAVMLKDKQQLNALNDKRKNILEVAGLDDASISIDERFKQVEAKLVDIETGAYVEDIDVAEYEQRDASSNANQSIVLTKEQDLAGIKRRANVAKIYLVKNEQGDVTKYILPVHGYGLWSTMYGFVSLESDANTIYRLKFYDQKETAGLGGEVENPNWLAQWTGKKLRDANGDYQLLVSSKASSPAKVHDVDGLAGATLTTKGVDNLFKFWMSEMGFEKYLNSVRQPQS